MAAGTTAKAQRAGAVALFRGLNVGGHHKVKMDVLRALFEDLGFTRVSTYINSGNVVFSATPKQLDGAAERIEAAFVAKFGFASPTVLRTAPEMRDVVARTPFAARNLDPAKIVVSFLSVPAEPERVSLALEGYEGPEEVVAMARELYLYFPHGMGRSKLPMARIEKALGGVGTARNWNTVQAIAEKAAPPVRGPAAQRLEIRQQD